MENIQSTSKIQKNINDLPIDEFYNKLPKLVQKEIFSNFNFESLVRENLPVEKIIASVVPKNKDPIEYFLKKDILCFEKNIKIYIHNQDYIHNYKRYNNTLNIIPIFNVEKGFYKIINSTADFELCRYNYEPLIGTRDIWAKDFLTRGYLVKQIDKDECCGYNWMENRAELILEPISIDFDYVPFLVIEFKPFKKWKNYSIKKKYGYEMFANKKEILGLLIKLNFNILNSNFLTTYETGDYSDTFSSYNLYEEEEIVDEDEEFRPTIYKTLDNKEIGYALLGSFNRTGFKNKIMK